MAQQTPPILHLLTLIELAARNVRESLCIAAEATAHAQQGPRLALATANGEVRSNGATHAQAAQHANAMNARAQNEVANLFNFTDRLALALRPQAEDGAMPDAMGGKGDGQ